MSKLAGRKAAKTKGGTGASRLTAQGKEAIDQPTPEQARRVEYERRATRDEMGRMIGFSYHRKALFETMAAKPGVIAANELAALRFYRSAYDRSARSPTKSCLDIGTGGGGSRSVPAELANATATMIDAKRRVRLCETIMGANLTVMRGFVLDDRSFSELAIERWGGRDQEWIVDGHHRTKILPRSGRHREIIRQEFFAGLRLLTDQLTAVVNMKGVHELWVEHSDAGATIERGWCAPSRRYRLWGGKDAVAEVVSKLREKHGTDLFFCTPEDGRAALDAANDAAGGRLFALEDDELAA